MQHENMSGLPLVHENMSALPLVHEKMSELPLVHENISGLPLVHEKMSGLQLVRENMSGLPLVHENISGLPLMGGRGLVSLVYMSLPLLNYFSSRRNKLHLHLGIEKICSPICSQKIYILSLKRDVDVKRSSGGNHAED